MILDIVTNGDDWVMTYLDGEIHGSGHSISDWDWSHFVVLPITEVRRWQFNFEENGYPPNSIDFENSEKQGLTFERIE